MARHTQDREDLLGEATALSPRWMLRMTIAGQPCDVFAGFRRDGAVSVYFDADPVFHFTSRRELRRAYFEGRILKAEQGQLYRWDQQRSEHETTMHSRPLSDDQLQHFGRVWLVHVSELRTALQAGSYTVMGHQPEDAQSVERLAHWLADLAELTLAESPRVQ